MAESMDKIEKLIYGYLRQFEKNTKLYTSIPLDLLRVIIMLYPMNKFKFVNRSNHETVSIKDDGSTLIFEQNAENDVWLTVQIGYFLTSEDKTIHLIRFKLEAQESLCGAHCIGFITEQFNEFVNDTWNHGTNGSTTISNNGYFITSKCFDEQLLNHGGFLDTFCVGNDEWYGRNDEVMIKIDTSKMKAIIWNATPPDDSNLAPLHDMNIDEEYEEYKKYYFQYDLPKHIPIALCMEFATTQTIKIIQHQVFHSDSV